jgi:hypothetical protein
MTTVKVSVTTASMGDVEVEVQDRDYYDEEGVLIGRLLDDAVAKVRRTYDI